MNIPWKIKSFLFWAIDGTRAYSLLYLAQKYITRRSRVRYDAPDPNWEFHKKNIDTLSSPTVIEFGGGKNLAQNIFLSDSAHKQFVVDLFPMFDPRLANDAAKAISAFGPAYHRITDVDDLSKYRIAYLSPLDVAHSNFPDDIFNCCISTNTLEHIPQDEIRPILVELKRILCTGGMVSAVIDYSDHYSHTDKSIGPLEFLRYDAKAYARHNHQSHFQNRLRHHDYENMFAEAGFRITLSEPRNIVSFPNQLASEFDANRTTTFATRGYFVLTNDK